MRLRGKLRRRVFVLVLAGLAPVLSGRCRAQSCRRMVVEGEVHAGGEWKAAIGEGWDFRLVSIPKLQAGYTGWDLVVDREPPTGFPDALYLATPPYNSINEREIGTTYGLRAQDAIGWNPRSFRFLADGAALKKAKDDYFLAFAPHKDPIRKEALQAALGDLLKLGRGASSGEFKILEAGLTPGTEDPAPFARAWALAASRTGYQVERAGQTTGQTQGRGALRWMRFRVTLWLPAGWKAPAGQHTTASACGR